MQKQVEKRRAPRGGLHFRRNYARKSGGHAEVVPANEYSQLYLLSRRKRRDKGEDIPERKPALEERSVHDNDAARAERSEQAILLFPCNCSKKHGEMKKSIHYPCARMHRMPWELLICEARLSSSAN